VLEFNRSPDAVWNLPGRFVDDLRRDFPAVDFDAPADRAGADALLPNADVVYGWAVSRSNLATARRLRWIHVSAAGVTPLLFPELVESPIVVTNGRGIHAVAMAEHTLGVILAFARKLHLARDAQRERRWTQIEQWKEKPEIVQLAGTTLGLVGLGAVGSAIAERAPGLGMDVVAVRRHPDPSPAARPIQWPPERLPELLARADWLVLALPLTQESRGLVGHEALARMKPGAVLINLGRGPLVDEPALIEALASGRISGAALDVFEREPLPPDSPLWAMPNVIVTPHTSGLGPRYWERALDLFRHNLSAYLDGRPLRNVVDKRAGY